MLTFAYGDIHGCHDKLVVVLEKCRRYAKGRPSKHVFLGDYIDRGPDSRGVIETVLGLQEANPHGTVALLGNHESLLLEADNIIDEAIWLQNGGATTLKSYGVHDTTELPEHHLNWLRSLPLYYQDDHRLFVHAGIRPGVPLLQQSREDLLWIREPFLSSFADHGKLVTHGHTPTVDGKPENLGNRINVDTGAYLGRPLTAAVFSKSEARPVDFLSA